MALTPYYGGGYGERLANFTPGGKERAPTNTGAKNGEENSPRISAVRKASP